MSLLRLEHLSKEDGNLNLLDDINLKLEAGQCMGIKCSEEFGQLLFNIISGIVPVSKGKIIVDENEVQYLMNKFSGMFAVILKDEGLYERLTINEYLSFFGKLYNFRESMDEIKSKLGLLDLQKSKINKLTYSQKKRVSFARSFISNAKLILIQEPTLNLDRESISIIREGIHYICSRGISVIAVSVSEEEISFLEADYNYAICDGKMVGLFQDKEIGERKTDKADFSDRENIVYKINKIPAKNGDKIILFNPTEIIFAESLDGTTYLNVEGEKYPCAMTLNELESRLSNFGFFRCHRSYLVNLQMVRELVTWTRNSFSIVLDDKNKSSIPLSKGKLNELKEILKF